MPEQNQTHDEQPWEREFFEHHPDLIQRGPMTPDPLPPFKSVGSWTPSTEGVREATGWGEAFDRWLAARDRENRAIGWDEGAEVVLRAEGVENVSNALANLAENGHPNPYRGDNRAEPGPACAECGRPSTYRLGMPEPSWCDAHGPKPKGAPHV